MCIELYLAVNLIADLALLGAVSHTLGLFDRRRIAIAGALCAIYALVCAVHPAPWRFPAVQALLLAVVASVIARPLTPRIWLAMLLSTAGAALVCGGVAEALVFSGPRGMPPSLAIGLLFTALLYDRRPPLRESWRVVVHLNAGGRTVRFPALIDTGNHLREPVSGLPVLIAEASLLEAVMPEGNHRALRFGALGGEGEMACFKPQRVWIERGMRRRPAPEVWVAASPDPLPGLYQALAPPEFAL